MSSQLGVAIISLMIIASPAGQNYSPVAHAAVSRSVGDDASLHGMIFFYHQWVCGAGYGARIAVRAP